MNKLSDWHLHTEFSSDSEASLYSMIEQAIQLGLQSICITDHIDYDYPEFDAQGNMLFQIDLKDYIPVIAKAKEQFQGQIEIYTGIEQGLQPHLGEKIDSFDAAHELDFIIGSAHLLDREDPYYPEYWQNRQPTAIIQRYFDYILETIQSCHNFDVYGHLDYIIRYAPSKDADYHWTAYKEPIDAILKALISAGKGIEINTAGLKYGLKETNPAYGILHRYKELGGEIITIGSDAHKPEHIAYDFGKIPTILRSAGFEYYTIFKKRKAEFIPL